MDGVPPLPLSQIESRFTELDPNQTYYIHCKAGVRSLKALNFLPQQGFKYLKSVKGGITAWSKEIDSKVPSIDYGVTARKNLFMPDPPDRQGQSHHGLIRQGPPTPSMMAWPQSMSCCASVASVDAT